MLLMTVDVANEVVNEGAMLIPSPGVTGLVGGFILAVTLPSCLGGDLAAKMHQPAQSGGHLQ